jgi:hypothetical protein
MEDQGWGDQVPVPGSRKPPGRGSGRGSFPWFWVIGGLVLLAIVGGGVALKESSGGSKKTISTVTTIETTMVKAAPPKPKAKPVAKTLPKAKYIKKADAICSRYNPKMNAANKERNLSKFMNNLRLEWLAVAKLKHPSTGAAEMKKAIVDAEKAIVYLRKGDVTSANNFLVAAHTIEGVFGMTVCNFGH